MSNGNEKNTDYDKKKIYHTKKNLKNVKQGDTNTIYIFLILIFIINAYMSGMSIEYIILITIFLFMSLIVRSINE
jgi:hypothetical protein